MLYLKLVNRMIGNCAMLCSSKSRIKWAEMGCDIETVQRKGRVFQDEDGNMISLIPISDENNALVQAAIKDTNENDFPEDTAEIVNDEGYNSALEKMPVKNEE